MARIGALSWKIHAAMAALAAGAAACATAPEPVVVAAPEPDRIEPYTMPQPGEACLAVWAVTPDLHPVEARGGMILGGGFIAAGAAAPAERDVFGCMGSSQTAGEVYVEARYAGGNYWHPEAWRLQIACSSSGAIGGSALDAQDRCASAALAPDIRVMTAELAP